jgi:hypothetical protein
MDKAIKKGQGVASPQLASHYRGEAEFGQAKKQKAPDVGLF